MDKRGDEVKIELLFIIFSLFVVGLIFVFIVSYINNLSKDVDFKEKYIAIDTGLLLNTIQASPGNLEVSYSLGDFFIYDIDSKESVVKVKRSNLDLGKTFLFTGNKLFSINDVKLETDNLVFTKNEENVDIKKNE